MQGMAVAVINGSDVDGERSAVAILLPLLEVCTYNY